MQKPAKKNTYRNAPDEVDRYLAEVPIEYRAVLEQVREIVRELVPEAAERVSYGVPIFRLNKDLLGYGANKKYCSIYAMSASLLARQKEAFEGFELSGTTIHFHPDKPLTREMIELIVRERCKELQA